MLSNKHAEQGYNAFWILLGIGICVESMRYGLWSPAGLGSGFVPFVTGSVIGGMGLLLYFPGRLRAQMEHKGKFWESRAVMKRVLLLMIVIFLMALHLPRFGFLITSIVGSVLMIRLIEHKDWTTVIVTSAGSCLALYLLFQYVAKINLPKGVLGF